MTTTFACRATTLPLTYFHQCVGGALFQLMNKRLTSRYPSITVAAYGYALGTVLLLLVVIPLRAGSAEAWLLRPAGCVALARACPDLYSKGRASRGAGCA